MAPEQAGTSSENLAAMMGQGMPQPGQVQQDPQGAEIGEIQMDAPAPVEAEIGEIQMDQPGQEPFNPNVLNTAEPLFSFRISQDYRVIFEFINSQTIKILDIKHRKDIYKKLK